MKIIEPTHKEIMQHLNCCHYGYYNKNKCQCRSKEINFKSCYESAKQRLTRTEQTAEEIAADIEHNKLAVAEIYTALNELYGD